MNTVDVFPQSETGLNFAMAVFKAEVWTPVDVDFEGYLEFDLTRIIYSEKQGTDVSSFDYN